MAENKDFGNAQKVQQPPQEQIQKKVNDKKEATPDPNAPDVMVIKAFPNHRIQLSYEFKGKTPVEQKNIALSILKNVADNIFLDLVSDTVMEKLKKQIQSEMAPKIVTPGDFKMPGVDKFEPMVQK